jgi:CHC2 zinc finger
MTDAQRVSESVPMLRLLTTLGFRASDRTHRVACVLHGGANPSSLSWREDGRWHCFACGRGGDRIALVRFIRHCGFRQAVSYLAEIGGVEYTPNLVSRRQTTIGSTPRAQAEAAAWRVHDELSRLRRHYSDALRRADVLCARIGERLQQPTIAGGDGLPWSFLFRLAPVHTFFLAAWFFFTNAPPDVLIRVTLLTPAERRALILTWDPGR